MNGLKISEENFMKLPEAEKCQAIISNLAEINKRLGTIEKTIAKRWKLNLAVTSASGFAGGFAASLAGFSGSSLKKICGFFRIGIGKI